MSKPVIVLIPGAWHPPSAFSPLTSYLEKAGYTVHPLPLKSVGAPSPLPDFSEDVSSISSKLTDLADQGNDIVVLTHSYGGIPGSSATKGLIKSQRESSGKKGGVVHLIYCCAFALPDGVSLMDALQHQPLPWFKFSDTSIDHKENKERLTLVPATPKETFYNEISDEKAVDDLIRSLRPQSYGAMWSGVTYCGWRDCPSTYILCEKDAAIPIGAQKGMVDGAEKAINENNWPGSFNRVTLAAADHTPFWSATEDLGMAVRKAAGESL